MADDGIQKVTAPDQTGGVFDLFAAAGEFYDKFPAFRGRVTFVDVTKGAIVNDDPEKAQQAIDLIRDSATGRGELMPIIKRCIRDKISYSWPDGKGNHIVFLYTAEDRPPFFGDAVPRAQELQFIFDHETGHIVVPGGHDKNRLKAENAADAYALVCDLQRNGENSPLPEAALLFRTWYALYSLNGVINFSSPVIEEIIRTRSDIAAAKMTPDEQVALAEKTAAAHTMDTGAAQALADSVVKFRDNFSFASLKDLVLETEALDTFKWSSTVLKAALDRRMTLPGTPTDDFNDVAADLRQKMDVREKQFAARPAPPTPPAP